MIPRLCPKIEGHFVILVSPIRHCYLALATVLQIALEAGAAFTLRREEEFRPGTVFQLGLGPLSSISEDLRRTVGLTIGELGAFQNQCLDTHRSAGLLVNELVAILDPLLFVGRAPILKPFLHLPLFITPAPTFWRIVKRARERALNGIDHLAVSGGTRTRRIVRCPVTLGVAVWIGIPGIHCLGAAQ